MVSRILQDLRYALRTLSRTPGFTATAVLTLALAIGANTAIFSIVRAVLIRPLPYPAPDQLVQVSPVDLKSGIADTFSYPDFLDWRNQTQAFEHLAAYHDKTFDLSGVREPVQLKGEIVSREFFEVFGLTPQRGYTLASAGPDNRAVLSAGAYVREFAADPNIVRNQIRLDGEGYTVVGIMPPNFQFPHSADIWVAMSSTRADIREQSTSRGGHGFYVAGRLAPGVALRQAQSEMAVIATRVNHDQGARVVSLHEAMVGNVQPTLLILMGSVVFVLLIACANLGNLMLVRWTARGREIAIRASLGAGRGRIVAQMLVESVLLSLVGGALGVWLAGLSMDAIVALAPGDIPRLEPLCVDYLVLAFSAGIAIAASIVFGFAPAWQVSRAHLNSVLNKSRHGSTDRSRLRSALVVAEIALSLMLLAGAGLLMKSLFLLEGVDPGFRSDHLLTVQVFRSIPKEGKPGASWSKFYQELIRRVEALPGVEAAGASIALPVEGRRWIVTFDIEGHAQSRPSEPQAADERIVSNNYLQVMRIPLRRGRYFSDADTTQSPRVAIVNEALARRYFPNKDAVGARITTTAFSVGRCEIVGVVGNIRQSSLQDEPMPEMYQPYTQPSMPWQTLVVRTKSDPMSLAPAIRRVVYSLDPEQPVGRVATMEQVIGASLGQSRFRTVLLGGFAALALLLAFIGVYGVMAYSVNQRVREIGIRIALGARARDAQMLVFRQTVRLAGAGLVLGAIGAVALTRVLDSLLYGMSTTDPAVFGAVVILLSGAALLASYLPARRAARVDPMAALREE